MGDSPSRQYLRDAVMTASPEQLQLMLFDGALRFIRAGREATQAGDAEQAYDNLSRAQRIVLEMQQGLRHEVAPELCERMSALYLYIYRRLVEGCVNKDLEALDESIRLLAYERETWIMLMEKLSSDQGEAQDVGVSNQSELMDGGGSLFIEG